MKLSFWKRETVSRAEYDAALIKISSLQAEVAGQTDACKSLARRLAGVTEQRNFSRAEAEANKVDAERYRAKLKRDRDYHAERRVQVKAEVA